jgi:hypothetical protein
MHLDSEIKLVYCDFQTPSDLEHPPGLLISAADCPARRSESILDQMKEMLSKTNTDELLNLNKTFMVQMMIINPARKCWRS